PVGDVSLSSEGERRLLLVEWNKTDTDHPLRLCCHELFERQARLSPEADAVLFANGRLSYAELNRRANRLARRLRQRGAGRGALVGLGLGRSVEAGGGIARG